MIRRNQFPDAYTQYPNIYPSATAGSVYSNDMPIYTFDIPYTQDHSRATGNFVAQPARLGQQRLCAYSCGRPSRVDLISSVGGNIARHY